MVPVSVRNKVLVVILFGVLAYIIRAANLITPLGGVFILDLRDFFVTIGAALGGPAAGLAIGICAGFPARIPLLDIASFATGGVAVGLTADYLYKKGKNISWSAMGMLCGYVVAAILAAILGFSNQIPYLAIRAIICIPLNIIIINNLLSAFPSFRTFTREEPPGDVRGSAP
jgi:hypothetical protein